MSREEVAEICERIEAGAVVVLYLLAVVALVKYIIS
jgi:hypothetical protein